MGRAEHKDPARQDRHFLTGLRIATDALALLADREAAERRQLHHLATYQGLGNLVQYILDQFGGLVARKTDLLIDGIAQFCSGYRPSGPPPLLLHSSNAKAYRTHDARSISQRPTGHANKLVRRSRCD